MGGGLNCEAKAQVLVVTPPPLFFLKVGRKRGGRNSGAVRYVHAENYLILDNKLLEPAAHAHTCRELLTSNKRLEPAAHARTCTVDCIKV